MTPVILLISCISISAFLHFYICFSYNGLLDIFQTHRNTLILSIFLPNFNFSLGLYVDKYLISFKYLLSFYILNENYVESLPLSPIFIPWSFHVLNFGLFNFSIVMFIMLQHNTIFFIMIIVHCIIL